MPKSFHERVTEARAAVPSISVREAEGLRHGCDPVVFLDPRTPDAIATTTGRIPGALNVPLADVVEGRLPPTLVDPWTRVVTACEAGPMGAVAAHELTMRGFRRVAYLEGGTVSWLEAGLETVR